MPYPTYLRCSIVSNKFSILLKRTVWSSRNFPDLAKISALTSTTQSSTNPRAILDAYQKQVDDTVVSSSELLNFINNDLHSSDTSSQSTTSNIPASYSNIDPNSITGNALDKNRNVENANNAIDMIDNAAAAGTSSTEKNDSVTKLHTEELQALLKSNKFLDDLHTSIQEKGRLRCYNCGMFGHRAENCLAISIRKACFNCGSAGHISRECKEIPKPMYCFRCKKPGHYTNECREPVRDLIRERFEEEKNRE